MSLYETLGDNPFELAQKTVNDLYPCPLCGAVDQITYDQYMRHEHCATCEEDMDHGY